MLSKYQVADTFEEYLGAKTYIASSDLKLFLKSPKHFQQAQIEENEESDDMSIGTMFHCFILEGEDVFLSRFIPIERKEMPEPEKNWTIKANKDFKVLKEKEAEESKKQIILPDHWEKLCAMIKSVHSNKRAMQILDASKYRETSFYSEIELDEFTIKTRVRPDALSDQNFYVSLKTTNNASPDGFSKTAHDMGYHISEAFYFRVLNKCLPKEYKIKNGFIIATENRSPFITQVYELNPNWENGEVSQFLEIGAYEVDRALNRIKRASETGNYEGYSIESDREDGVIPMNLPAYAITKASSKVI